MRRLVRRVILPKSLDLIGGPTRTRTWDKRIMSPFINNRRPVNLAHIIVFK
jgi:hypothetical protein